jgi:hemerythrin-like domain-containing protein
MDMPGPIDSLRFAHTALEREITDLERLVTGASAPKDAAALSDRFAFLDRFCEGHTRGEEVGLFPDLDAKIPKLSSTYVFDHGDERAAFGRIRAALDACGTGDEAALTALRREVTAFADHLLRHIRKENELVLPLVHEHFSIPEQAGMVQRVVGQFSPDDMAAAVPFMVGWLDPEDRVRYVGILANALPPPALKGVAARIKGRLDAAAWTALAGAVPAINQA